MKFTSEDLLKAMGLKVGDIVLLNKRSTKYTVQISDWSKKAFLSNFDKKSESDVWLCDVVNEEYTIIQHKPILTEDEKVILRNIEEPFKFITRSKNGGINVHISRVCRDADWWENGVDMPFDHLFQFIKWEDEPYSIEELLKE